MRTTNKYSFILLFVLLTYSKTFSQETNTAKPPVVTNPVNHPAKSTVVNHPANTPIVNHPVNTPAVNHPVNTPTVNHPVNNPVVNRPTYNPMENRQANNPAVNHPVNNPVVNRQANNPTENHLVNNPVVNRSANNPVVFHPLPYSRPARVFEGRSYYTYHEYYSHPYRPAYYGPEWHPIGFFLQTLVAAAVIVSLENREYRYYNGIYYEPYNGGYRVINAPIGILVSDLPPGYEDLGRVGDIHTFYYAGIFYVYNNGGYQVVNPPAGAIVNNLPDGCVAVNIGDVTYMKFRNHFYQPVQVDGQNAYEVVNISQNNTQQMSNFNIGQTFGGGIIYFVDGTGQHGLISSTNDQNNSIDYFSANNLCQGLSLNGYNDWRIPSKDELIQLYNQRNVVGGFAISGYPDYWTSTPWMNKNPRFTVNFINGTINGHDPHRDNVSLRVIRSF